jgi:hypothetical protein
MSTIDIPNGVTPSSIPARQNVNPLQETLDRIELVDPLVSDISHVNLILRPHGSTQAAARTIASTLRHQQS